MRRRPNKQRATFVMTHSALTATVGTLISKLKHKRSMKLLATRTALINDGRVCERLP